VTEVAASPLLLGDNMEIAEYLRSEPMVRRQGFFDELMLFGSKLPWRAAVFSAVVAFAGLHMIAIETTSPATETTLLDLAGVVQHTFIHVFAAFLQYLVPIGLLIGATLGFIGKLRADSLLSDARANLLALGQLNGGSEAHIVKEAPICPKCGGEMVARTATRGQFVGHPFWGCRKNPQCTGVARIA
jgi:hypothetical protein